MLCAIRSSLATCLLVTAAGCSDQQPLPLETVQPPPAQPPGNPGNPGTGLRWPSNGLVYVYGDELRVTGDTPLGSVIEMAGRAIAFPAFSADGSQVALSMVAAGENQPWALHVLSNDGSLRSISPPNTHDLAPTWSPDGGWIAFQSRSFPNGDDEIYVMRADGSVRKRLTNVGPLANPGNPAWSPDGRMIAYGIDGAGDNNGIYVTAPDGQVHTRVNTGVRRVAGWQRPAWSADGRRLAFLTDTQRDIGIVNVDGTDLQYVSLPIAAYNLAWSPDGRSIAFNDQCHPNDYECSVSLWRVDLTDGSVLGLGHGWMPTWVRPR